MSDTTVLPEAFASILVVTPAVSGSLRGGRDFMAFTRYGQKRTVDEWSRIGETNAVTVFAYAAKAYSVKQRQARRISAVIAPIQYKGEGMGRQKGSRVAATRGEISAE